jgi:hypothetical protein
MSSVISSTIGLLPVGTGIYPYYKLAAIFFSVMLFRQLKKGKDGNPNGLPLPPGPKGYPLIGNLFDMPVHKPWVVYDEWRKTYGKLFIINHLPPQITSLYFSGDMIYLNVLGHHFVILGSLEVVTDLFEKRSSNYSDRKHMTMLNDLYVTHFFSPQRTCQECRSIQNELGYKPSPYPIRPVVAKTQEVISRVFPP